MQESSSKRQASIGESGVESGFLLPFDVNPNIK